MQKHDPWKLPTFGAHNDYMFHWEIENNLRNILDQETVITSNYFHVTVDNNDFTFACEASIFQQEDIAILIKLIDYPQDIITFGSLVQIDIEQLGNTRGIVKFGKSYFSSYGDTKVAKLSDVTNIENCVIHCFVDIRFIEYKEDIKPKKEPWFKIVPLQRFTQHSWQIDIEKYKSLKKGDTMTFAFGNDTWFFIIKKGEDTEYGFLFISVMPYGIKEIKTQFVCQFNSCSSVPNRLFSFTYNTYEDVPLGPWCGGFIIDEDQEKINCFIELNIGALIDDDGNLVDQEDWIKYGIY